MTEQGCDVRNSTEEIEELRARLEEAEETLRAIRSGEVDALVVSGPQGNQIYTLRGAESAYRVLVEAMNEGALVLTPDGTVTYSNHAFADMVGTPLERVIGSRLQQFVAEPDKHAVDDLLEEGKQANTRRELELSNKQQDRTIPALVSVANLPAPEAEGLSAVVTDLTVQKMTEAELREYREHLEDLVKQRTEQFNETLAELEASNEELVASNDELNLEITERQRIEEELRAALQRLDTLIAISPLALIEWDAGYRIRRWSEEAERLFGWTPDEVIGKRIDDFRWVYEEDWTTVGKLMAEMDAGTRARNVSANRNYRKDGSIIYTEWYNSVLRDGSGQTIGILSLVQDVTERKQAEDALRQSEERFRVLIANLSSGVALIDQDGKFAVHNTAFLRMFGLPEDTTINNVNDRHWAEWQVYDEDGSLLDVDEHPVRKAALTGEPVHGKLVGVRPPGAAGLIWMQISAEPVFTADGRMQYTIATYNDMTERVRAQKEIAEAKELAEHQAYLLQRALIPESPPTVEGYSIASAYVPATEGTEIGGDFLDVFRTEDGKVGIMIGDVSGKGIESAALAATTRSTIRAFAYDSSDAASALTHANRLLASQQLGSMQFVTAWLAVLDPITGEMNYASAGHPPAVILRRDSSKEFLETHNTPLGVVGVMQFEESCAELGPGDKLMLYTDGVTEARRDHEFLGTEGLVGILDDHGAEDPASLVNIVIAAVKFWSHPKLRDDTAVVVIGRHVSVQCALPTMGR